MMVYLLSFPDIDVQFFTNPDLYHLDALIALKFDFDELFLNGPVSINLNYKARSKAERCGLLLKSHFLTMWAKKQEERFFITWMARLAHLVSDGLILEGCWYLVLPAASASALKLWFQNQMLQDLKSPSEEGSRTIGMTRTLAILVLLLALHPKWVPMSQRLTTSHRVGYGCFFSRGWW